MKFWMKIGLALSIFGVSLVSTTVSAQIPSYYNDVDLTLTGLELRDALSSKLQNSTYLPYTSSQFDTWKALRIIDENPENSAEVLLVYGWSDGGNPNVTNDRSRGKFENGDAPGQWNREHVFPRSLAVPALTVTNPGPGTDIHNLRPCDLQTNTLRNNFKFIAGSGNAGISGSGWYPGDEWKGDVARIVMYMYLRYNGNGSSVAQTRCLPNATGIGQANSLDAAMLNLFLVWNAEDPVSAVELQRNAVSQQYQNNRNPFIDCPSLATLIWSGPEAEDPWLLLEDDTTPNPFSFELDAMILSNGALLQWTPLPNAVGCEVRGGPSGGNDPVTEIVQGFEVGALFVPKSMLNSGTTYQWKVRCATGTNPITGLTPYSSYHTFSY
jgi:endonuclease I